MLSLYALNLLVAGLVGLVWNRCMWTDTTFRMTCLCRLRKYACSAVWGASWVCPKCVPPKAEGVRRAETDIYCRMATWLAIGSSREPCTPPPEPLRTAFPRVSTVREVGERRWGTAHRLRASCIQPFLFRTSPPSYGACKKPNASLSLLRGEPTLNPCMQPQGESGIRPAEALCALP